MVSALMLTYFGPVVIRARSRLLAYGFWDIATFLINGSLWVFVGVQIPGALRGIYHVDGGLRHAVYLALAVTGVTVVTRFVWVEFSTLLLVAPSTRACGAPSRAVGFRARFVTSLGGIPRCGVAGRRLAVPLTTLSGAPFPDRSLIIFVVVVGHSGDGPRPRDHAARVVRWARMPEDVARCNEVQLARSVGAQAALEALPVVAGELGVRAQAAGSPAKGIRRTRRGGHGQRRRPDGPRLGQSETSWCGRYVLACSKHQRRARHRAAKRESHRRHRAARVAGRDGLDGSPTSRLFRQPVKSPAAR